MTTWPILSVVTFLPMFGALLIYISRGDDEAARRNSRWIALWTTVITLVVSLILVWRFDAAQPDFQFVEKVSWLASGITYHMGVDGISLPFVILTTALMPFCSVKVMLLSSSAEAHSCLGTGFPSKASSRALIDLLQVMLLATWYGSGSRLRSISLRKNAMSGRSAVIFFISR